MSKINQLLLLYIIFSVIYSCRTAQPGTQVNKRDQEILESESQKFSTGTRKFLDELSGQDPENLSHRFIVKYNISEIEGSYYIGATLKVTGSLDTAVLKKRNILIGSQLVNNLAVKIPVQGVRTLHSIDEILYVDIDRQVLLLDK